MKVAVLFSGGKDSAWASYLCLSWGWDVQWVTVHPIEDSMMFHHPNTKWAKLQAKAAGIKLHEVKSQSHHMELEELKQAIKKLSVDGIVSGAVASEYQKQRIEEIGDELNLPTYAPLWHKNPDILKEMLECMQVYVVSASAQGLDEKWLAKRLEPEDVDRLIAIKPEINPFFEGGEGETFVCDAPFFRKKIEVLEWGIKWSGQRGHAKIIKARLAKK